MQTVSSPSSQDHDEIPLAAIDPDLVAFIQKEQAHREASRKAQQDIDRKIAGAVAAGLTEEAARQAVARDIEKANQEAEARAGEIEAARSHAEYAKRSAEQENVTAKFNEEKATKRGALRAAGLAMLAAWSEYERLRDPGGNRPVGWTGADEALADVIREWRCNGGPHDVNWPARICSAVWSATCGVAK
jgi:hypothetical protein